MNQSDQNQPLSITSLEIFSRPSPVKRRSNEDTWLVVESPASPRSITLAVIDGAGVRRPLPSFVRELYKLFPNLTPAAYAAYILKKSLEEQLQTETTKPLSQTLITANQSLRDAVEGILGYFDLSKILTESDESLRHDVRNIRMVLPACVATIARLNLSTHHLEFAHLGDTSLLEICYDGRVVRHTTDQMRPFDSMAFEEILNLQRARKLPHFRDAVTLPEGRHFIIESGLRLNYVDTNGKTDKQQGCGVINGLPEMTDYIETGTFLVSPERTQSFLLLTDGLELLSPLYEKEEEHKQRLRRTAHLVQESGLDGLYNEVSKMAESDSDFDRYPRTKYQDDATGIYIQVGFEK